MEVVKRIGADLDKLAGEIGFTLAVMACQNDLPEGLLESLSPTRLADIASACSGYEGFDQPMKDAIVPLLEKKGVYEAVKKEANKQLTAKHVKEVCKFGCDDPSKTCSFLTAGPGDVSCAKGTELEGVIHNQSGSWNR